MVLSREKATSGKLKGYWLVFPKDKVKNRAYKGTYYTNGTNSFTKRTGLKILEGTKKKSEILKSPRSHKYKNEIAIEKKEDLLIHFPGFKKINARDSIPDRKYKSQYLTDGNVSFTINQARRYVKGEISYNDLIAISFDGKLIQKPSNKPDSITYRFHKLSDMLQFIKNQNVKHEMLFVSINVLVKRDSIPDGKRIWTRPLPATFIASGRKDIYGQRIRESMDKMGIMDWNSIIYDVTFFTRG